MLACPRCSKRLYRSYEGVPNLGVTGQMGGSGKDALIFFLNDQGTLLTIY